MLKYWSFPIGQSYYRSVVVLGRLLFCAWRDATLPIRHSLKVGRWTLWVVVSTRNVNGQED